jgi:hypothetical protein
MIFFFKNKGILVPGYLAASILAVVCITALLSSYAGIEVPVIYNSVIYGFAFIGAGVWTYLTRDSYLIVNGRREAMGEDNSFFFLSMQLWAYIYLGTGVLFVFFGSLIAAGVLKD